jgi:hypothetical protein
MEPVVHVGKGRRLPKPEDIPAIIHAVADGKSLRAICAELGIDTPSAHNAIKSNPIWDQQYAGARELRGEGHGEDVLSIAGQVLAGKITPDQGRVAIDAKKWSAGQMAPKTMAARKTVDLNITGPDLSGLSREELQTLAAIRRKIDGGQTTPPDSSTD